MQEDDVEEIKEGIETHEEPKLEVHVGGHCETRLVCTVNGLIIIMIEHPHQRKLAGLDSLKNQDDDHSYQRQTEVDIPMRRGRFHEIIIGALISKHLPVSSKAHFRPSVIWDVDRRGPKLLTAFRKIS